jgi:hypothetical protein
LDYYHACEYLHAFSREHFNCRQQEEAMDTQQKELLLESSAEQVIRNVEQLNSSKKRSPQTQGILPG